MHDATDSWPDFMNALCQLAELDITLLEFEAWTPEHLAALELLALEACIGLTQLQYQARLRRVALETLAG